MAHDETDLSFDPPHSIFGTWLGVVLLFVVFALFVWAVMGAMPRGDQYEEKRAQARVDKFKTTHEEQISTLHGYAWVDKGKGVARIPIERAMQLTTTELAQKKPTAAGPIAPETAATGAGPQTTAPAAPSSAAAPTATPSASPKASAIVGEKSEIHGQPTGAANPPNAAPGTQPGPSATPAATPPAPASHAQPNPDAPTRTPPPAPPGTPIPLPGATP